MVTVEISNAELPEKFEIQEELQKFLDKFQERWKITSFKVYVDTHSEKGRKKYSMHVKVVASDRLFVVKAYGWDIPSTLSKLFEKLSKIIGKELKKKRQTEVSTSRKLLIKRFISCLTILNAIKMF